ncbi:hypothetical protein HMPREF1608_02249 [Escherichia coli 908525]|uniref:Uncharacterized protein n=1 Tax=Escherichia coli (strain SMS-3-5 / SECEC) TaxID=439855 RepID=B1LJW5_ECOSM|nr:hypothetical protein EcSMS35_2222 [Escherichia coli SMS-3-5]AEQ11746.1 hypothetical protein CE10_0924 [Escherichia coli O7:K1 str. CE10]EGE65315.1 hypothetical protein ECSTEC7V_1111 [Escherichia coli STEC_7v]EGW71420.1 hypothetical protein ECSTECC16502_1460 [Escherichia coli STEC_C165-02]EIG79191.1 hypothetical protein EC12741_4387 [Escherichia coli 1.2741]ESA91746.1 hypothetical protein HMPREF1599_01635 [Escherichia coli 907713]ESD08212.1 hypothetical protein HMPREF1595_02418 [Escherichia
MRIMPPPKTLSMGENTRISQLRYYRFILLIHNANAGETINLI